MKNKTHELRVICPNNLTRFIRGSGLPQTLFISIFTTIIAAFIFYFLVLLISKETHAATLLGKNVPEAVMIILSTSLLIGGGIFIFVEYAQREHERIFRLHTDMILRLMCEEDVNARRGVFENIPMLAAEATNDERKAWILEVRQCIFHTDGGVGAKHIKTILNSFDYLGLTALNYWRMEEDLAIWLVPIVTKVWDRIGPYIKEESIRRNEPKYYIWARRFGNELGTWWKTHSDFTKIESVDDPL